MFLRCCTVAGDEVATTREQARAELIVDGLPVRMPTAYRGGRRSYPGLFWAAPNDRTLACESLLELDRLWLADFGLTVTRFWTQPFQITDREGTGLRAHVPDRLLVPADRSVTVVDGEVAGGIADATTPWPDVRLGALLRWLDGSTPSTSIGSMSGDARRG